jgi:hypothetical protein
MYLVVTAEIFSRDIQPISKAVGINNGNEKKKQSRYTPWWRLGGEEYSSYSFFISALDGGEWSASHPSRALAPGEVPQVPIVQEAGPRAGLDTEVRRKILCLCQGSNPDRPVVEPVVRHYTDWATPAP